MWLLLAGLAVANGVFRELLLARLGHYPAHVLTTAMLVTVILFVTWLYFGWMGIAFHQAELSVVGIGWVALTVGFEVLVGALEGTPVSVTLGQ